MSYSVPLYTYSDPDFSLPISLDYNYSGYRPSQHSGYVGLGWNLNCGGVITREIVGLPDDYDYNGLRGFYYLATSTAAATLRDSIANGSYTTTFDSFDFANYFCHTSPYVPGDQSASTYFGTTARNAAVSYGYDELGRQSFTSDDGLVQLNQYTLQGWMLRKNVAQNDNMIFWEILRYADPAYSGMPRYNGTLSEVAWNPEGGSPTTTYAFEYDGAGRLKNTARIYGGNVNNAYTERNLTYDRNGNILSLKRYGTSFSAPADNFSYTYDGNRLSQLNGSSYAYDDNGNMTADGRQGLEMEYNVLNLPRRIEDAQTGVGVSYSYLADGTKAEMRRDDGTGLAYAGDMVFTRSANGAYTFESAAYCNGRLLANGTTQKFVTDHLGSVRAVVTGGQVVERNDYYPLGMRHPNPSYSQLAANRYGYNGKERQAIATSGTYLDYGARFLDPVLGRWTTTDPMAEKYLSLTPYNFCGNDPINYVDPDGQRIIYSNGVSDEFRIAFSNTIKYMNKKGSANNLYLLEISPMIYYIDEVSSIRDVHFDRKRKTIYWDYSHLAETDINMWLSPATTLDHEAAHAVLFDQFVRGMVSRKDYYESTKMNSDINYGTIEERQVITKYEQNTARKHGEIGNAQVTRNNHGIKQVNGSVEKKSPQEIQIIIHDHNSLL